MDNMCRCDLIPGMWNLEERCWENTKVVMRYLPDETDEEYRSRIKKTEDIATFKNLPFAEVEQKLINALTEPLMSLVQDKVLMKTIRNYSYNCKMQKRKELNEKRKRKGMKYHK
jgi:hypothetical protein